MKKEEFENLYNKHYKEIYFVSLKIVGDEHNAKDITQEAFLKAFTNKDKIANEESFVPYVRMIAHNCAISYLRHCQVIKFESVDEEGVFEIRDDKKGPEDEAIDRDVQQILMSLIEELPTEQKIVLFMFYYENMSVKEIADICGCPEKTIYSRLTYAKKNLKDKVEKLEDKGVKLRCVVALPFIYAVFKYETGKVYASVEVPECTNIIADTGKISAQNISVGGKIMKSKILGIILAAITGIGAVTAGITAIVKTKSDNKPVEVTTVAETLMETDSFIPIEGNSTENKEEYIEGDFPSKMYCQYYENNTIYKAIIVIENTSDADVCFEVTNDFDDKVDHTFAKAGNSTVASFLFFIRNNAPKELNYYIKAKETNLVLTGNDDINVSSYAFGNDIFIAQEIVADFELCCLDSTSNYIVIYDKDNNVIDILSTGFFINVKKGDVAYTGKKALNGTLDHYEVFPVCMIKSDPHKEIKNTNVELFFTTDNGGGIECYTNFTNNNDFAVDISYQILAYNSDDVIVGETVDICYGIMPSETIIDKVDLILAEGQKVARYEISRTRASRSSKEAPYPEDKFVIKENKIDKNTFIVDVINNTGNEEDIELKVYAKLFDADGNIINMFTGWDFFKPGETQETIYLHSRSDDKYNIDVDKIDHIEYFVRASKR